MHKPTKNTKPQAAAQKPAVHSQQPAHHATTNTQAKSSKKASKDQPQQQSQQHPPQQVEHNLNLQVQQQQQPAPTKQEAPKLAFQKEIKLTQLLQVLESDKQENKVSFFVDQSGNAFTFFKYKGEVVDLPVFILDHQMKQVPLAEGAEKARKMMVYALKNDGMLVLYLDFMRPNLVEFFTSGTSFFSDPQKFFDYKNFLDEKWHKKELLTPEEDVDHEGNKGHFYAKGKDFKICILCTPLQDQTDPDQIIMAIGLGEFKACFNATLITP